MNVEEMPKRLNLALLPTHTDKVSFVVDGAEVRVERSLVKKETNLVLDNG